MGGMGEKHHSRRETIEGLGEEAGAWVRKKIGRQMEKKAKDDIRWERARNGPSAGMKLKDTA